MIQDGKYKRKIRQNNHLKFLIMIKQTFLLAIISILCMSCDSESKRPSDDAIKHTVYEFIGYNKEYICPAKNFGKAYNREIRIESWNGVFQNNENEYVAKITISYDDCWKKELREPMNFFFHKNTLGTWVMDQITFDMANQFSPAPQALYEWYKSLKIPIEVLQH